MFEESDDVEILSGQAEKTLFEYKEYYDHYTKEYGEKCVVWMQVGKFYEIYSYEEDGIEPWTNLRDISKLTLLSIGHKRLKQLKNPYLMIGVGTDFIGKFRDTLLENGYVVVFIDQESMNCKNPKRSVSKILTSGTQIQELRNDRSNTLVSLYIENATPRSKIMRVDKIPLIIGMASIDLSTGETLLYATSSAEDYENKALDETYRFLQAQCASEVTIMCKGFSEYPDFQRHVSDQISLDNFALRKFTTEINGTKLKNDYQKKILQKVYFPNENSANASQLLNLEKHPYETIALIIGLESVYECRPRALRGLQRPEVWKSETHLVLEHNAIEQLDITSSDRKKRSTTLFGILNHTETSMGRRKLEQWILNPLLDPIAINSRLYAVEALTKCSDEDIGILGNHLRSIPCDTVRFLRLTDVEENDTFIRPKQFFSLQDAFNKIGNVFEWVGNIEALRGFSLKKEYQSSVGHWLGSVMDTFDLEKLEKVANISTSMTNESLDNLSFFQPGVMPEIDKIFSDIQKSVENLDLIAYELCCILHPDIFGYDAPTYRSVMKDKDKKKKFLAKVKLVNNTSGAYYHITNADLDLLKWYRDQATAQRKNVRWWKNAEEFKKSKRKKNAAPEEEEANSDEEEDRSKKNFNAILKAGSAPNAEKKTKASASRCLSEKQLELLSEVQTSGRAKTRSRVDIERATDAWVTISTAADRIRTAVDKAFKQFVTDSLSKDSSAGVTYREVLYEVSNSVAIIDCLFSNARAAQKFGYHRPEIVAGEGSFIESEKMRHPIIERILKDTEYVPHNISLNSEGRILFATNDSGKTTCCKSVALNVVMAQCGSFVAASKMRINPFHNIITRLSGHDDMRKGKGTFAVEMSELKTILSRSTRNSLVLGDEICHGTEYPSAVAIVAASIVSLSKIPTNFIFATHLHALSQLDRITSLKNVTFHHFHVTRHPETGMIVYDRAMKDGPGEAMYGIEVAEAQGLPQEVIELSNQIRREVMGEPNVLVAAKQSRYSKDVIMDVCSVPECEEQSVETHHIKEQQSADEKGMIDGRFHKNSPYNQAPLCKAHHQDVTFGRIQIPGWIQTAGGGKILKVIYEPVKKEKKESDEVAKKKTKQSQISSFWKK